MTSYRKGLRVRLECMKALKLRGWLVGDVEQRGRFKKEKDLFGLFDLVGVRERVLFVQVTCGVPHSSKPLMEFVRAHDFDGYEVQQWVRVRSGWSVIEYGRGKSVSRWIDLKGDVLRE